MFYQKKMLEKAAAIKRFEDLLLRKQTSVAEKQYNRLDRVFKSNIKEEDKIKNKRSRAKSNLVYS